MIRFLSLLSIACIAGAFALLAIDSTETRLGAVALLLLGAILSIFLMARAAVMRVRDLARDVRAFASGDIQEVRLVNVDDPKGWFSPAANATLEFRASDGTARTWDHDVPVPFPVAWGYRLGKRFNVPVLRSMNLTEMLSSELRREGMKVTLSRPSAE